MLKRKINGINLHFEISGQGPSLLLIMGLGSSARLWTWFKPLLEKRFRVITFDNRGAGRTDKPKDDYSTDLFADDTRALIAAMGLNRCHVMGISMGGMIAQKLALRHPKVVDRLILGCTFPNFNYAPPDASVPEKMNAAMLLPQPQRIDIALSFMFSKSFLEKNPQRIASLKPLIILDQKDQGMDGFVRQFMACAGHDTMAELKNINSPTLVITGDADVMAPPENSRLLASEIPSARLVEIPDAGHAFFLEESELVAEEVAKFLLEK